MLKEKAKGLKEKSKASSIDGMERLQLLREQLKMIKSEANRKFWEN
jgi:hypothetical protein